MQHPIVYLWIVLFLVTIVACTNKPNAIDDEIDAEIAKIKSLSAMRAEAFNQGNAETIAAAFTDDGVLMAPDANSTSGREAVRAYYQGIFDQYQTFLESGYNDVKVSGDLAYGVGFAKVKLVPHNGGDTLFSTAKYINILQRQNNGTWLTTYDIWNGNGDDHDDRDN